MARAVCLGQGRNTRRIQGIELAIKACIEVELVSSVLVLRSRLQIVQ